MFVAWCGGLRTYGDQMRSTLTINFRGGKCTIKYKDYGYERDTNAHDVDWEFVGEDSHLNDVVLTADEEQQIYENIIKHADDSRSSEEEPSFYDK